MEDVNKQLLDALKGLLELHDNPAPFSGKTGEERMLALENQAAKRNAVIYTARQAIAAAAQAKRAEPSQEWFDYLIEDVSAIDCMYRGDPMYEHDAYWMKDSVIKMLEKRRDAAGQTVVPVPTIKLGLYGRAFDTPQTRRAYTYHHQPNNLDAYNLGRAAASTSPGGDNIDRGLSLLKELQAHGFGVFELGDQQECGA